MKALGYVLSALACWLLRTTSRVLVAVSRSVLLLAVPLASRLLRRRKVAVQTAAPLPADGLHPDERSAAAPALPIALTALTQATNSSMVVADRIVPLRLDPPVGVIHLRVYQAHRIVRGELIVLEPCLRALLKCHRHPLPEMVYDPVEGLAAIKNQAVLAAETFINTRGNAGRHKSSRSAAARRGKTVPPAPIESEKGRQPTAVPPVAAPVLPIPAAATTVAPRVSAGYCYVGTLVKAGTATVRPDGRPPYDIFEATLQLDNGAELALRGAELQRELQACHCTLGQRIAITPMGKVPVALANGTEGQKNLYRVQPAEALHIAAPP